MNYCMWCGHIKDAHTKDFGCFIMLDPETGQFVDCTCFDDNRCICPGFMDKRDIG